MEQSEKVSLTKNIIANTAGRMWTFMSIFLFVPIYVKLLGIEAYGVITFYTVLLTFMAFADAGFSATLNREFARIPPFDGYKANLLVTFEKIYILLAVLIAGGTYIFAEQIVHGFLDAKQIPFSDLVYYVRLMGVAVGMYIFSTLYQGGLMGLQQQVKANVLSISFNAIKAGLVIIPLLFWRSLDVYLWWQIGVTILYLILNRIYVYRAVGGVKGAKTHFEYFKPIWRYTVGMMLLAMIYAVNTQVDKLTVGNLLPLTDFGYYFMASSVAQASLMLATPIGMALFPELSRLVSIRDVERVKELYCRYAYILATIISIVVIVLFAYCNDYITIWQQDAQIAQHITPTTRILLVGYMFMGIQLMPYYLALANGYTRINVILGICSVLFIIPSMAFFVGRYGLIGASYPWLLINSSATLVLGWVIIRKFMKGNFWNWVVKNSLLPVCITMCSVIPIYLVSSYFGVKGYWTLLSGAIMVVVAAAANLTILVRLYPEIKTTIFKKKF